MKLQKLFIFATIFLITAMFQSFCLAQNSATTTDSDTEITSQDLNVAQPTVLPNSKFYFLKNWQRAIQSALTFGQVKKAELNLQIASEKLLEATKLADKTNNPQILDKATELYNKQMEKIQENIAKFKGTATSSEAINKFLDKYAKQQILHNQILEKLESKVSTSTMEKIKENREKHLEKFGQTMQKLEDKAQIQNRLENALNSMKNNEIKDIVNLEIINKLKEKFPTSTQEQLERTKQEILDKIKSAMPALTPQQQDKVENYLEKTQNAVEKRLEIIDQIKEKLPATSTIKQKIETIKEKLQTRQWGNDCVCAEVYSPICGADGKTYGNPCKAKCQNIGIVSQGPCKENATTSTKPIVGGDKDEHGCIGSAGYSWCQAKQKCLRNWEEKCEISTSPTP